LTDACISTLIVPFAAHVPWVGTGPRPKSKSEVRKPGHIGMVTLFLMVSKMVLFLLPSLVHIKHPHVVMLWSQRGGTVNDKPWFRTGAVFHMHGGWLQRFKKLDLG
jgi:hypothetical protein